MPKPNQTTIKAPSNWTWRNVKSKHQENEMFQQIHDMQTWKRTRLYHTRICRHLVSLISDFFTAQHGVALARSNLFAVRDVNTERHVSCCSLITPA